MGCSPSVLLEHIHRDSAANQGKNTNKHQTVKKDTARTVIHRKSSLALTPEDEPLDLNCCGGVRERSSTFLTSEEQQQQPQQQFPVTESQNELPENFLDSTDLEIIDMNDKNGPVVVKVQRSAGVVEADFSSDIETDLEHDENLPEKSQHQNCQAALSELEVIEEITNNTKTHQSLTELFVKTEKEKVPRFRSVGTSIDKYLLEAKTKRRTAPPAENVPVKKPPPVLSTTLERHPSELDKSKVQPASPGVKEKPHKKKNKRGPQEAKYGFLLPPLKTPYKILLVFHQTDQVAETHTKSAEKIGFEVTVADSVDAALEEFQSKSHEIVVVDARAVRSLDFNTLCRSIKNARGSQHSVLVAVVKKGTFEKDDESITSLLDSGFNRCIVESTSITGTVNELNQIKHSDMRPMAQHATCQAIYAALDKCKDLVVITDDGYRCQYVNRISEKILNFRPDELLGKTLQEQLAYDSLQITTMGSSLLRGREWSGQILLKKKNQETITANCRAVPMSCAGRMPSHFVLVLDIGGVLEAVLAQSRGSVHSIRRGSTDVRSVTSDFYRRTSLAKLNALPLEAPITKLIGLIDQARENSPTNTQLVQLLDRVEDILKCPELYSPQVKENQRMKTDEPVVSDLITALLSKQPQPVMSSSSRRSSNDSSVFRPSKSGLVKLPTALRDLLDTALAWDFDIFRLEELSKNRPLQHIGMSLFNHFEVANVLNCDEKTLQNWLIIIEANYHKDNSYHNSTHAADVMQATAGFLEKEKMKSIMDPLNEATSLIAAAAHDVDHPGKSSAFLSNSDNPLAILYNDITILESHHAALMFKLTLGDERVNIFKNLDKETYKLARHNVIDMILATEMTKHFEHLAKFVNVFCTKASGSDSELDNQEYVPLTTPENITLIKRMMIKCSDVSNPTRPLRLCVEWSRRIAEEYFQQTDEEKERGLPVVMPMFDRKSCSIPKSQIGFVDYIINDMFEAWNAFIDMPELITYMRHNYIRWKEFDEEGFTTLADICKLQTTVLMTPTFPQKTGGGVRKD